MKCRLQGLSDDDDDDTRPEWFSYIGWHFLKLVLLSQKTQPVISMVAPIFESGDGSRIAAAGTYSEVWSGTHSLISQVRINRASGVLYDQQLYCGISSSY